jgi:hypothetical protein
MGKLRKAFSAVDRFSGPLALFLVLTGGTAWAIDEWSGANIVNGSLTTADYRDNDIRSVDVRNDNVSGGGLTGADIRDQSGVDTCVSTIRIGQLRVRAENSWRNWDNALRHCANLGLRMPSLSEGLALAEEHDIPAVDEAEYFWTADLHLASEPSRPLHWIVQDNGDHGGEPDAAQRETVCVTTPTN